MTILVTGSTGVIGSRVVAKLAAEGADVHAMARSPEKAKLPVGVTPVLHEIVRPQNGRGQIAVLDHTLHCMFPRKLRDISEEVGVENGQVDDALDDRKLTSPPGIHKCA